MSIFARINRLQYVTRFYGRNTFLFHPKIQTRPIETIAMPISISKLRTCLSARYTRRKSKKKKKKYFSREESANKVTTSFRERKKNRRKLTRFLPCRLAVYQLLPLAHRAESTSRMQTYVHRSLFYRQPPLDRNQRL